MQEIAKLAEHAVERGCHLANLATVMLMGMLGFNPAMALKTGGYAMFGTTVVLLIKALRAPLVDPRDTHVWCLIDQSPQAKERARTHVAQAMRAACLGAALPAAAAASLLLGFGFFATLIA